jgi:adenylate kinase
LKKHFTFSLINTNAPVEEVRAAILKDFQYQSSLDLANETYDSISTLPLASDLGINARQNLVRRLDSYQANQTELFKQVIQLLREEFYSVLEQHFLAGEAIIRSSNKSLTSNQKKKRKKDPPFFLVF